MMTALRMSAVLALCTMLLCVGCYNPPVEKMHSRKAMDAGDYTAAEQKLIGVVEHDPSDWEGHYLLGLAYLGQQRPVQAQSQLELALTVKDRSKEQTPKILDALGQSLEMQGAYDQLYAFLDAQIARYEGWQDYARKARFLAKANDIDGAALAYRQAAYFSRNETERIYLEIATFYENLGDYDKAIQALKWAYYLKPDHTQIPGRFRKLGVVPGPTLREAPPQPEYAGAKLFGIPDVLPNLIGD